MKRGGFRLGARAHDDPGSGIEKRLGDHPADASGAASDHHYPAGIRHFVGKLRSEL
jgi:hypothetical protein